MLNDSPGFRTMIKRACTIKLPFPVYGKGVGDGSYLKYAKLHGYLQNLYPKTIFELKRGSPPRFTRRGQGWGPS